MFDLFTKLLFVHPKKKRKEINSTLKYYKHDSKFWIDIE